MHLEIKMTAASLLLFIIPFSSLAQSPVNPRVLISKDIGGTAPDDNQSVAHLLITAQKPWDNGRLKVSENQRFLQFENGKPFFWLGETAWLMPERLNRDEDVSRGWL